MTKPFHFISDTGNRDLFIFGDHASSYIPECYENLGLSGDNLTRHIAWDIGTEIIVKKLCEHFGCGGQLASVSRLVIDLNRDCEATGLIPEMSDGTLIPGNQGLSTLEREARIERFYAPYHSELGRRLDVLNTPFVLSVHSFTPRPLTGEARQTDIGLLVKHDEVSAEHFIQSFKSKDLSEKERCFNIGLNLPYSAYDLNYTIDAHIAPRNLRHLAIEIRQDHIQTDKEAIQMADILAKHISYVMDRLA